MNKYRIKRTDPNTGIVMEVGPYGEETEATNPMPYKDCKVFLYQHQEDLRVYKVAKIASRKGAKRRLYRRIVAPGFLEAIDRFKTITADEAVTMQLCTGDWKVLAEKTPTGEIKYYLT